MQNNSNKYIAVAYKLYSVDGDNKNLIEEATADKPFQFISGFGITLETFEKQIAALEKGEDFDFTLTKDEAYGDFVEERVLDLDKEIFSINGHFDHDNIYVDAVVPLQNEDGNRFYGHILSITDDKVRVDLNHPLAGKSLNFVGSVVDSRDATNEEIQSVMNQINGEEGCSCGCDSCEGGCGSESDDHQCGCGHCH
jgi:FKBP-type peptidyl-prolyl cis-trans isomerase SlyD